MSDPESKIPSAVLRAWRGLRGTSGPSRLWLAAGALVVLIIGFRSCQSVEAGEVAVRVNNVTGSMEVITQPGLILRLPFGIQDVYILDVSPQTFHLRGQTNTSVLERRELEVRASDGSNFAFNDTTILFRAIPGKADETLRDSGLGHAYYEWMVPYARAILRDEFGRESTLGVSNPTTFHTAEERAKTRLNKLLGEHGVEVTSIVTPRPRFSKAYEDLIESRNQAENQLAVIDSDLQRAKTERDRKLAEVDRDGNKVIQTKRAELEAQLAEAVTAQTQTHREVDSYKIDKLASGEASRSGAKSKSTQLKGELDAEYAAKQAEIDAFRNQPVERVMERLGDRLKGVTIEIQPYQHDGSPKRIQLENVGAAAAGGAQ
ncbi:MAG TPA: SPFH domain-containing protein [Kofleriaceae bacterium]|nr:SPFH domain-containing protein [Kofleriaceae bacterium]